jgi:flagellar basal-body rod protein FlgG
MNGAIYIGATGLDAQERALDVVSNNIANINTSGFKRSQVQFIAMLGAVAPADAARSRVRANVIGAAAPAFATRLGSTQPDGAVDALSDTSTELMGVKLGTTQTDFSQGTLAQTGHPLDVAISGDGFFELAGPGGQTLLWRGGTLTVNSDGYLAASNGMPLKSMISIPVGASSLTIGADGKVQAVLAGSSNPTAIGQITLATAKDPSTLSAVSGGLYAPESEVDLVSATPGNDGMGMLVSGSIEASNVNLASEMVSLMLMQRAYAANAQVVQAGDQLMAITNELRR